MWARLGLNDCVCAGVVSLALSYNRLVLVSLKCVCVFWCHSPVLGCVSYVSKSEFGPGAALSSAPFQFRGRRSALELFLRISWQAQYFDAWVQISWQPHFFE